MSIVAVLGMGAMGSPMAAALLKAGHEVKVWNRSPGKTAPLVEMGAEAADTPRAAVKEADFAICMVRDDDASRDVWLNPDTGALAGLSKNSVAIESSTVTVAWARELAKCFSQNGITFLDAPVAGSRPQAKAGQLIYFVGGEADAVAKAEPVLKAMGNAVHHAGPSGSGAAVKLAVNALFSVQVATVSELIGLMQRCGLDETKVMDIVSSTPVCSPAAKAAAGGILARNFAPMFPIELVEKDLGYVFDTAKLNGALVPMAKTARDVFTEAIRRGHGDENITAVSHLYL